MDWPAILGALCLFWVFYVIKFAWSGELKFVWAALALGGALLIWLSVDTVVVAQDERYDQTGPLAVAFLAVFVWPMYLILAGVSAMVYQFGKRSRRRLENENLNGIEQ